jgi:hypothetical protein
MFFSDAIKTCTAHLRKRYRQDYMKFVKLGGNTKVIR